MSESTSYSLKVVRVTDVVWSSKPFRSKVPSLYVRVALGDTVRKTRIIRDNPSPEWNEFLSLSSSDGSENINFRVKHNSSLFCNSCIASVDISLSDLLQRCANGEVKIELQAPPRKGRPVTTSASVLHVHLRVSDKRSNTVNDLEGVQQAVARSDFTHFPSVADTTTAILAKGKHLNGGSSLYTSLALLCSKLDTFVSVIDTLSTVHPYVNVAWNLASSLYKTISNQIQADEKVVELAQAMNEAFNFTNEADAIVEKAQSLHDCIVALLKQTAECCIFIQAYVRRGFADRMLDLSDKTKIDEFTRAITTLKRNVESGINLSAALISARMSERVDALFLRDRLDPRQSNAFDRPQCLPGTREDIQKQILAWMFSESDQNIFWLHGVAGSGKSTVSTTFAEYLRDVSRRGAFLYFERGKSEPNSVIRSMAYELATFDSSIAKGVITAIERDNNVAMSSAANQFEKLLLQPLAEASTAIQGPVVVVLDALDECGTPETRRGLMKVIRNGFRKLPKTFRFFITSRPEDDICKALAFQTDSVLAVSLDYTSETSQEDVLSYLRVEMDRIVREESEVPVPKEWPWDENVKRLSEAAGGLFIWAATAVKLVSSRRDNPFQKLVDLVENSQSLSLAELYTNVLTSAISWEDPNSRSRFLEVFSFLLFSKEPLTIVTIDGLLGYPPESSSGFLLSGLRSVVDYSPDRPVRLFHASFSDYLLAPEHANDPWFIDAPAQKTHITTRCFDIMQKSLRFNICGLASSYIRNDAVPDLQMRVETQIRSHLSYACLFWAQHLREAPFSSQLMDQLLEFLHGRLLYWLEVLSLSKKLARFHSIFSGAIAWTPIDHPDILAFLRDADNLVTLFFEGISQATPQLYISLLPLSPKASIVATHYLKHATSLLNVKRVGHERPPQLLKTLKGHKDRVTSVAFSPNGTRIASGSNDMTVRVWDASSGIIVAGPFEGHTQWVTSVAFSPDGMRLASGSYDRTVRVWDAGSGEVVAGPFEGHEDRVTSVAFAPDGLRIASGSFDNEVRVWNANSGEVVAGPFMGHREFVMSVTFSPDGSSVASGSYDKTIRVWNASSGGIVAGPFKGHASGVTSVVFSPNGTRLASGSYDKTIRLWDTRSGEVVAGPFEGHASGVAAVAFSPDGTRLASGSYDNTVRVWRTASGEVIAGPFESRRDVASVAFSPDGMRIASGSYDRTVRVWNASSGEDVAERFEGHTEFVASVAFSPDGKRLVSGSGDKTIRIWDVTHGKLAVGPFEGHLEWVFSVTFSPDGMRIASGSFDKTVRVWDGNSGEAVTEPFRGHTDGVTSVVFSPDGLRIASGSYDRTVRVWNVNSAECVAGPFEGHTNGVTSVAFSPDGMRIASGSGDGTIRLWDASSGYVVAGPFEGHSGWVLSVVFSPNGLRLASGSVDSTIRVWDAGTGAVVAGPFEGHTGEVRSVAFSPDGTHIASGSADKTVRVWDAKSGGVVAGPFKAHSERVTSVAFSPDGTLVASGSSDKTVRVWDVCPAEMCFNASNDVNLTHPSLHQWSIDESGWIKDGDNILLWVPPFLRGILFLPQNTAILSCPFYIKLDFSGSALGNDWHKCFNPD